MRRANILTAAVVSLSFCAGTQAALRVTAIGAGGQHSLALAPDGTVWEWGYQHGANTRVTSAAPKQVGGIYEIVAIAGGSTHSLAIKGDGTVWAWGFGGSWCGGGLGDGMTGISSTPVQVSGLSRVVAVAGGWMFSLALSENGTVRAWGCADSGQLGDGTRTPQATSVEVAGLTKVVAIAAGYGHALAVKDVGTVWTWGLNSRGQLGDGTILTDLRNAGRPAPVQVSGLTDVTAVAGGLAHSLALKRDGRVWAWGSNDSGQLGDGTTTSRLTPIQVSGLTGAVAIAAGSAFSLALKGDGTVWAWGSNEYGQLADGTTANQTTPVQVGELGGAVAIAASGSGGGHSLALKGDGTAWAWGSDDYGQLGDGAVTQSPAPLRVSGLTEVAAIAAGESHSMAVKVDGTAWSWGSNGTGQLGDGTTTNRSVPVRVSGLDGVIAAAAGVYHSLALKADGTVWKWGDSYPWGESYQEGGDRIRPSPVQVTEISQAVAIAAGNGDSYALKSDGTVWSQNSVLPVPVGVGGLSGVVAIATGVDVDFGWTLLVVLKGDGSVCPTSAFRPIPDLTDVVGIAAGTEWSGREWSATEAYLWDSGLALRKDGTVWNWQWGSSQPAQVRGLAGIKAIAMSSVGHSLALRSDGTVWAWGLNAYGELGDGTTTNRLIPVQVAGLDRVVAVAAFANFSLALKADGTVWAWGDNSQGKLGIGAITRSVPGPVIPPGSPDLAIALSHAGDFTTGERGIYTLTITNVGSTATTGTITFADTLPPGLSYISGIGDGWACSAADALVTCSSPLPLEPGASSTITLAVEVGGSAWPGVTNLAAVSNESDRNIANNIAGDPTVVKQP